MNTDAIEVTIPDGTSARVIESVAENATLPPDFKGQSVAVNSTHSFPAGTIILVLHRPNPLSRVSSALMVVTPDPTLCIMQEHKGNDWPMVLRGMALRLLKLPAPLRVGYAYSVQHTTMARQAYDSYADAMGEVNTTLGFLKAMPVNEHGIVHTDPVVKERVDYINTLMHDAQEECTKLLNSAEDMSRRAAQYEEESTELLSNI